VAEIRIYGASWCPDCRRAKKFLADQRVPYEWHDIETDPDGVRIVQERNNGNNIIPTIIFPDDSHLEPSNEELAEKIGLERMAMQHVYDLIIVGGGPTGLTTAIYAVRENLETLIVDSKGLGGQAGVTERLDNYPGFIATDATFMTSVPGVFAAGDVRGGSTKQLASAVGEGAAVAIQIRGYLHRLESEAM
jgi:thioredoxin reductase (NADPH)